MASLSMENIVRPFVKIESRPLQIVTPAPVTDLVELPPAFIQWGAPSNFITPASQTDIVVADEFGSSFAGYVNRIQQDGSIFDYARELLAEEISRETRVLRIYNPIELETIPNAEDRTQYLDVEVIDRITFRMPDGETLTYVLNNAD